MVLKRSQLVTLQKSGHILERRSIGYTVIKVVHVVLKGVNWVHNEKVGQFLKGVNWV